MNRYKATHEGTCQWCGRVQKLPGGTLAKHGYTTKWGFFMGVCHGADQEPFELSCDLVKQSIVWAQEQLRATRTFIEVLEAAEGDMAWTHERVQRGRRSEMEWREVKVEMGDFGGMQMPYITRADGRKEWAITYGGGRTVKSMVKRMNEQRVWALKREVTEINGYINHQTERVANWKPALLKEVKA